MTPPFPIGHYRVTATLGAGGMGAVYRATDTKLQREVAIKVLPAAFAADTARMQRFEREAQVLASLNHPNIAAIYGVEEGAIVMELVEGAPLKGPVAAEIALDYAKQIGAGLAAAHERGIIHRDLKPANIHVTPEGIVKLLDFGLAKAVDAPPSSAPDRPTESPTVAIGMTQAGTILGTAAYMAPEQARGKTVDKRADIWAFGAILYELLTGKALFAGETTSDILAQVLTKEPDLSAVPPRFRPVLRRCLERDPKQRLRDIGDVWLAMESAPAAAPRTRLPWVIAAACAMAAAVFGVLWMRGSPPGALPLRFTVDANDVMVSPDGRTLLRSRASLEVRPLEQAAWVALPNTDGGELPFWAEDCSGIGFFSEGRLKIVSRDGKNPRNLAAAPQPVGGTWRGGMSAGKIVFASAGRLHAVDVSTGSAQDLPIALAPGESATQPVFLPEGDGFVFLRSRPDGSVLYHARLGSPGTADRLFDARYRVAFARNPHTGAWHIFYSPISRVIVTAPIDPRTGVLKGKPVRMLEDLANHTAVGLVVFDVGDHGIAVWRKTATALPIWRLRWFDLAGKVAGTVADPAVYISMALSADEKRVAVLQGYPDSHIWVYGLQRGTGARLSPYPSSSGNPLWSPDSRFVYYTVAADGGQLLVRQAADGSGQPDVLYRAGTARAILSLQDITADGKYAIMLQRDFGIPGNSMLRVSLPASGENSQSEKLLPGFGPHRIGNSVRLSPDGHWLLIAAADVTDGAYLAAYPPSSEAPRLISRDFSSFPFFSRDGRTLYGFRNLEPRGVTAQAVVKGPDGELHLGERLFVFPTQYPAFIDINLGATTRDGSRILAITGDESEESKDQVLTDWTTLLPATGK